MLRWAYTTSVDGDRRCRNGEFYLQKIPSYRGITKKVFYFLYQNKPKVFTIRQISKKTDIDNRSVNGVISFNVAHGYIDRYPISHLKEVEFGYIVDPSFILLTKQKII